MPRSAVCLNHEGSLEPKHAAMESLLCPGSSTDAPLELEALLSTAATEIGRLEANLDVGLRCCHESVPERAKSVALSPTFALECDEVAVDAELLCDVVLDLLMDPNPWNSGTSSIFGEGFSGSMAGDVNRLRLSLRASAVSRVVEADGGVMSTGGDVTRLALVVTLDSGRVFGGDTGVLCFSGEMDRARSVVNNTLISPCALVEILLVFGFV